MFGLEILDVAIGLFFVYLTLSLAVTAANEMFAAWFKRRAWMLKKGLSNLLDTKLAEDLLKHPLVSSLYEPRWTLPKGLDVFQGLFGNGPSYIPSRTFAVALLDLVAPMKDGKREMESGDDPVRRSLSLLWEEAGHDTERFKEQVEVWFNNSMERVSGWYKRHTQAISLLFAAIVTVATNADTIAISKALWNDPALRQAVVARAERYAEENQPRENSESSEEPDAAAPPPLPPDKQAEIDFEAASMRLNGALADLQELQLPIGWESKTGSCLHASQTTPQSDDGASYGSRLVPDDCSDDVPGTAQEVGSRVRAHALGWLLTIMAISMGSPFWFDILNRVIAIRSAGKAPEERQKPPKEVPKPRAPGET